MKRKTILVFGLLLSLSILTACTTSVEVDTNNNRAIDNDTVLWINEDGTDCDYGDFLEGDKDCDKKKKKVLKEAPSKSSISSGKSSNKKYKYKKKYKNKRR